MLIAGRPASPAWSLLARPARTAELPEDSGRRHFHGEGDSRGEDEATDQPMSDGQRGHRELFAGYPDGRESHQEATSYRCPAIAGCRAEWSRTA
jgi:hypothetical protein